MNAKFIFSLSVGMFAFVNLNAQEPVDSLTHQLQEIVVTARQPATRLVGTTLESVISGTQLQNIGNMFDLLRQLPMLEVEDQKISVTGRGVPEIFIDGRPCLDVGLLEELQSSDIRKVELDMAPGAQYAAETKAILKIYTRQRFVKGLSVTDEMTFQQRRKASTGNRMNFLYRRNAWELFGAAGFDHEGSLIKGSSLNRFHFDSTPGTVGSVQHITSFENSPEGRLGFNYSSSGQSFGAYYNFTSSYTDFNNAGSDWLDSETPELKKIMLDSSSRRHIVSVYYDNMQAGKCHVHFDGNFRTDRSNRDSNTDYDNASLDAVKSKQKSHSDLWASKLYCDFQLAGGKAETGIQNSFTRSSLDYRMLNSEIESYIPSSESEARQVSCAAYFSWNRSFGNFFVKTGLRYEYIDFLYRINDHKDNNVSRTDNLLTPDVSLGYTHGDKFSVNLSYRMSVLRPPYRQLTSGLTYVGRHEIEGGNPALRDEKMHNLQFFGQFGDFILQTDFIRSVDSYAFVKQIYPAATLQLLLHPVNVNVSSLSSYLVWNRSIGVWTPEITLGVYKPWLRIENSSYNKPIWSYEVGNTVSLPQNFLLTVNARGQNSGNMQTHRFAGSWFGLDLGLRKSFRNNTWSVKLLFTDVFNTRNNDWSMSTYGVSFSKHQSYDRRGIRLSVQYRFQPRKSKYIGGTAAESEMNRL